MSSKEKQEQAEQAARGDEPVEAAEGPDTSGQPTPETDDLQPLLEDARAKADEHWNQLLRLQAEMENLRKRAARDVEHAHKYALERFVQELLPVKDSLELGLSAAGASGDEGEAVTRFIEGMELTLRQLTQALEKFGVVEVDPVGQPFNPEHHQAITMQPAEGSEANTVLSVMQKGYLLNERLVRPALVVVAS